MKKNIGKVLGVLLVLVVILIGILCYGYFRKATYKSENPVVTIEIADYGTIKLELYPDKAPNTVKNFIALAKNGYYDGKTFYEIDDLYVQAGDGTGAGTGSPKLSDINPKIQKDSDKDKGYSIKSEAYYAGNTENNIPLEKGILAMRTSYYSMDSAGSEFFIVTGDFTEYNGYNTAFGKVIEGEEILDKLAKVERTKETDETTKKEKTTTKPKTAPVITKITVDEKNGKYGVPETIDAFDYYKWLQEYYGIDFSSVNAQ